MDRDEQVRLREVLRTTLDDQRLSRGESEALKEVVDDHVADRSALAFLRNEAFRLAKDRVEESPREVLAWLDRVDKIVDHALRAPGTGAGRDDVAFSPGDGCLKLVRGAISGARKTIDICVFTITDDRITEAILEANKRGVEIRVITDDDKAHDPGSDIHRLTDEGIAVRTDEAPDHMHHKFAIIDERTLLSGSYNWTRSANRNFENLHATDQADVVEAYFGEFERLWDAFA